MKIILSIYLLVLQTPKIIHPTEDGNTYIAPPKPEAGTAFNGWIDFAAQSSLAVGAILALLTAIRIFKNIQLGTGNAAMGITNLILGMAACLVIRTLIFGIFQA